MCFLKPLYMQCTVHILSPCRGPQLITFINILTTLSCASGEVNFLFFLFNVQIASQVEEMSAEANKERKLRARSDQVHRTSFVLCLKIDILGMREKNVCHRRKHYQSTIDILFIVYTIDYFLLLCLMFLAIFSSQYSKQLEEEIEYLKVISEL